MNTQEDCDEFTRNLIVAVKYKQYYLTGNSKIRSGFDNLLKRIDKLFYTIAIFSLLATIMFVKLLNKSSFAVTIKFGLFFCGSVAIVLNIAYLIATHGTTNLEKAQNLANKATHKIYNVPMEVIDKVTFAAMVGKYDEARLTIERQTRLLEISHALSKVNQASIEVTKMEKIKALKRECEQRNQHLNEALTNLIMPDLKIEEQQAIKNEGDLYLLPDDLQSKIVNRFIDNL